MSTQLVQSVQTAYLTHAGAANSFFVGSTQVEIGNIASTVGADDLRTMYDNNAAMQWTGTVDTQNIPATSDYPGQYLVVDTLTAISDVGADYTCRRAGTVITNGGRIQTSLSTNGGLPMEGANDARFCIYYPSEDFNQEVISIEYITTDGSDIMQGNNITNLLNLTRRMKNFSGNNGPVCTGVASNDLYDTSLSIFKLGCLVTWESPATSGNAIIIAPSP